MNKPVKIIASALAVLFILIGGGILLFATTHPDVDPAPDLNVAITPERLEQGRYLAHNVAICVDCHSTRDFSKFAGPIIPGTEWKGEERFDESMGFPGTIYAGNLTPAGIGTMTDGELYRAITSGVRKDGSALFPFFPYKMYDKLSEEDLFSIVAYLRSLKPVESQAGKTSLNFPMNILVKTMPVRHTPVPEPNRADPFEYGEYLVNAANCTGCHTMQERGEPVKGMEFAGGMEFKLPTGISRSTNMTPDEETGIGLWTKELFVSRFKDFADSAVALAPVGSDGYFTVMPWTMYAGMREEDLEAIYTYLRTIPPVRHEVEVWTPADANGAVNE